MVMVNVDFSKYWRNHINSYFDVFNRYSKFSYAFVWFHINYMLTNFIYTNWTQKEWIWIVINY